MPQRDEIARRKAFAVGERYAQPDEFIGIFLREIGGGEREFFLFARRNIHKAAQIGNALAVRFYFRFQRAFQRFEKVAVFNGKFAVFIRKFHGLIHVFHAQRARFFFPFGGNDSVDAEIAVVEFFFEISPVEEFSVF